MKRILANFDDDNWCGERDRMNKNLEKATTSQQSQKIEMQNEIVNLHIGYDENGLCEILVDRDLSMSILFKLMFEFN